ncbi:hypothetical protein BH10ACT8_BH10ACT8_21830 [soil metagenome]
MSEASAADPAAAEDSTAEQSTAEQATAAAQVAAAPVLRIVKGNPTPEEIAAVTVLLTAPTGDGDARTADQRHGAGWTDPNLRLRRPIPAGPGAWRASVWY